MRTTLAAPLLGLALICAAGPAWADGDPATENVPRVVPYDGVLNLDGQGITGTIDVLFTLYDGAEGGQAVWSEAWTTAEGRPVAVRAGRFSVNLGTYEDISATIADAEQVYLGIQVKQPESENFVALGGRQRLNPVPYALWSAHASDLTVAGALSVGGPATVGGGVTTTDVVADRYYLTDPADSSWAALQVRSDYLQLGPNIVGNARNGVRITPNLRVDGTSNLKGAVDADATLNVDGASTLRGAVDVDATLNVDGTSRLRGAVTADGTVSANRVQTSTLQATGAIDLSYCRLCLKYSLDRNGAIAPARACVRLAAGEQSPVGGLPTSLPATYVKLHIVCDGGPTETVPMGFNDAVGW